MIIDTHNHFIPDVIINEFKKKDNIFKAHVIKKDNNYFIEHEEGFVYPLLKGFYDYDTKMNDLGKMKIDKAILSPSPTMFFYWSNEEAAKEASIICNDWVCSFTQKYSENFIPMGMIPMVNVDDSINELERIINKYRIKIIEIGPNINGTSLDEEKFYPIYDLAEKNNIVIFLHPYYIGSKPMFERYYLTNIVANPLDTTLGLLHLIYGGVFEKYPNLRVIAAHGGGFFPYQIGRFNHGLKVRKETKIHINKQPEEYRNNIFFDSITHWEVALEYLIQSMKADRVVIGTDYPFDMGEYDIVEKIEKLNISLTEKNNIFANNIKKYL